MAAPSTSNSVSLRSASNSISTLCKTVKVNTWECAECFGSYEDDICLGHGEEWIQCACDHWIHEKTIDNAVFGKDDKERFCSICVV